MSTHVRSSSYPLISVCSNTFKKCYILIPNVDEILQDTTWSWSNAEMKICRKWNWTLVSIHSQTEQDFIGYHLLHKFEHINNKYSYIGMYE